MSRLTIVAASVIACAGCTLRPSGWTEETHGKRPAAYELVFPTGAVKTMRIVIAPEDYAAMQADLQALFAGSQLPGGGPSQAQLAACVGKAPGETCSFTAPDGQQVSGTCRAPPGAPLACVSMFPPPPDGGAPPPDGGVRLDGGVRPPGGGSLVPRDPLIVPVDVVVDGVTWWHVGMRYKGNSSLAGSFRQGIRKLPFRLDFDRFEDQWPEVTDQRFYGFGKLTFSSNYGDNSQSREAFVASLHAESGVPSARWAFYRVVIDAGNGDQYLGLYTAIEDPADSAFLIRQFSVKDGNLYKPEGPGADWTRFNPAGFVKKTNELAADWSDVERAIASLHASRTDPASWRQGLETTLDVPLFLRWLAINTVVQNWDAYGAMPHNYYLYGVPAAQGRFAWIPWDHNFSLGAGPARPGGGGATLTAAQELLHTLVDGSRWPLIRFLLDDPVYMAIYRAELQAFVAGPFAQQKTVDSLRELHALIAPHLVGENGEVAGSTTISSPEAFAASIDGATGLAAIIAQRHARVQEALSSP